MARVIDHIARKKIDENINMSVPYYLMASMAYYKEDNPILTDTYFDELGKMMFDRWDEIERFHKHLISKEDLSAGTYLGEYNERIKGGLKSLRKEHRLA